MKSVNHSTLTVEVNGERREFKDEAISFPRNVGGKRSFTVDQIDLGYGLDAPLARHNDYGQRRRKAVVQLGRGPQGIDRQLYGRALAGQSYATDQRQLSRASDELSRRGGQRPATAAVRIEQPDFTTVQRLDSNLAPAVSAKDDFFEFLFSHSDVKYAELKEKAAKQEPLPSFTLKGVKMTFNLDAEYKVARTQYTRNVIGIIEGTDPRLKDTYVAFGAHYDHVGYAEGESLQTAEGQRRQGAVGRVKEGAIETASGMALTTTGQVR